MKTCAAGLHIGIGQILLIGKRNRMDKNIETTPLLLQCRKNFFNLIVFGHVARKDDLRADAFG